MYQALYRKWRPQTFDQVVGQQHITETLKNQVKSGRLSHAYIFIGTRGTGKTTCARILSRAVNCEHPVDGNPCGVCAACRGIADGSILDVVELDAASNNGVDNVRALREEAVFSPTSVKKRVYIVDEVHMLSIPAFNALLKILEEPPEHLMFILATTELQKVPATILSRCQRHSFKRIDTPEIAAYLEYIAGQEHFDLSHEAAELIARLAEGGVRDALSLLDQCSAREKIDVDTVYSAMGLAGKRRIAELLDLILRHDTAAALRCFSGMWMDGKDPATLLDELNGLLRDVLMLRVAPKSGVELLSGGFDGATLRGFGERMTKEELLCAMETLQAALISMRNTGNPRMTAELCLVSLCDSTLGESVTALRARVSRLEEALKGGAVPVLSATAEVREEAPEEPAESPVRDEPPAADTPSAGDPVTAADNLWQAVRNAASAQVTPDIRFLLEDDEKVRGAVEGDVIRVEAAPGFVYARLNRPDVLQKLSDAAANAAGHPLRVLLSEMRPQERQTRSLDELRNFKEVRFVNE